MDVEAVQFADGLREEERPAAAALYVEAFGRKLGTVLGDDLPGVLARTFHLDRALVARRGGVLVGLAGVGHGGRSLIGISRAEMWRTYGPLGGTGRLLVLGLFARTPRRGELVMDGIAVDASARGLGIGTGLLRRVAGRACEVGADRIRLDVVDTNPRARRLYEREGFAAVRTESVPYLERWLGFRATTTMIKRVGPPPSPPAENRGVGTLQHARLPDPMPKALTHLTVSRTIAASPRVVWEAVARGFGDVAAYNPAIARSEWMDDRREGVGAGRVCHVASGGVLEERITAWDDGRSFELELVGTTLPMATVRSRVSVEPDGEGTRVTQDFWYRMKGMLGPFSGLLSGQMRKTLDVGLEGLAAHLADPPAQA